MKKINVSLVASFLIATNLYSQQTSSLDEITISSATKSEEKLKSYIKAICNKELKNKKPIMSICRIPFISFSEAFFKTAMISS